jgi:hypothetical protein
LNGPSPEKCFVNNKNEVFVTGMLFGTANFGAHSVTSHDGYYSEMFVAKLCQKNLVNISENKKVNNLWKVYPNPSGDIFTISGEGKDVHYVITDVRGQIIRTEFSVEPRTSIDLSPYARGVYFVQIRSGNRTETKKLVKN